MKNEIITTDTRANIEQLFESLDVSAATRKDYKDRIGVFLHFAEETGLNKDTFLAFKRNLAARPDLAVSTKNKYLTTAKVFLKEATRQGIIPQDITLNVKTFSQSKKHRKDGLNDEEIQRLTESLRSYCSPTPEATRLKAIIGLLVFQGLRQVEITRLDVKDLDFVAKTALVQGKGQDDKEPIHLHPEAVRALQDYIRSNKIADGALFTSRSNNSKSKRLLTRAIRDIVTTSLKELGIEKSTHGFRHYFTTKLIETYKGDLLEVARYTRHKSLEMLQVYNDTINHKADLPRFYGAFNGIKI